MKSVSSRRSFTGWLAAYPGTTSGKSMASGLRRSGHGRRRGAEAGGRGEHGGLVGLLPREVVVLAAEVAVGRGLLVDRPMELEVLAEGAGAQVEVLVDQPGDRSDT